MGWKFEKQFKRTKGRYHIVAFAIYILKISILRQKKNYGKFKYFTLQKYNLRKNALKQTKIFQDIRTL
jgi:hypothetical protein